MQKYRKNAAQTNLRIKNIIIPATHPLRHTFAQKGT